MKSKSLIMSGAAAFALLISPAVTQASTGDAQPQENKQQQIECLENSLSQNSKGQTAEMDWDKLSTELSKYNIDLSAFKEIQSQKANAEAPTTQEQPAEQSDEAAPAPVEEPKAEQPEVQQPAQEEVAQSEPAPAQESADVSSFEEKVVELTNAERSKEGLPALELDTELSKVAEDKSLDMQQNQYFSHTSPTHGSPFDMMKAYGIEYNSAGENIAMGQSTPEEVVQAWMDSEGHRANIMSSSYTHIGVGHVENGNYWTQMFIGK